MLRRWFLGAVGIASGLAIFVACSDDDTPGTGVVNLDGGADARGGPLADGGPKVEKDSAIVGEGDDAEADCDGDIVINELEPAGDGGAEFVELFNSSTNCALNLANFKLMYRSGANVPGVGALHVFGPADAIRSKQFLLFANDKFVGKKDGDLVGSMGNAAGQVALVNDVGEIVDAVGYGDVKDAGPIKEAGPFTEGKPVPVMADTVSIGRKKDGVDTDDNSADFKTFKVHSAGVSNE